MKRKHIWTLIQIALLAFVLLLNTRWLCGWIGTDFGVPYNKFRNARQGIPIPEDWDCYCHGRSDGPITNPKSTNDDFVGHSRKIPTIEDDTIVQEEDYFESYRDSLSSALIVQTHYGSKTSYKFSSAIRNRNSNKFSKETELNQIQFCEALKQLGPVPKEVAFLCPLDNE